MAKHHDLWWHFCHYWSQPVIVAAVIGAVATLGIVIAALVTLTVQSNAKLRDERMSRRRAALAEIRPPIDAAQTAVILDETREWRKLTFKLAHSLRDLETTDEPSREAFRRGATILMAVLRGFLENWGDRDTLLRSTLTQIGRDLALWSRDEALDRPNFIYCRMAEAGEAYIHQQFMGSESGSAVFMLEGALTEIDQSERGASPVEEPDTLKFVAFLDVFEPVLSDREFVGPIEGESPEG